MNAKLTKPVLLARRIEDHGRKLLAIFPNAVERDPATLCRLLRRIELEGSKFAVRLCNGPEFPTPEDEDNTGAAILIRAKGLLFGNGPQDVPIFLNRDPRGYALKIDDAWMREHKADLHQDWGGYGIIAPDLSEEG